MELSKAIKEQTNKNQTQINDISQELYHLHYERSREYVPTKIVRLFKESITQKNTLHKN